MVLVVAEVVDQAAAPARRYRTLYPDAPVTAPQEIVAALVVMLVAVIPDGGLQVLVHARVEKLAGAPYPLGEATTLGLMQYACTCHS